MLFHSILSQDPFISSLSPFFPLSLIRTNSNENIPLQDETTNDIYHSRVKNASNLQSEAESRLNIAVQTMELFRQVCQIY